MLENFKLDCIRCDTVHDLADAVALATNVFADSKTPAMDKATFELSKNLFIGVALDIAYTKKNGMFSDMLDFLSDPGWDSPLQMFYHFDRAEEAFQQKDAAAWRTEFIKTTAHMSREMATTLVRQCRSHWKSALRMSGKNHRQKSRPSDCISVFKQELIASALNMTAALQADKREGAALILENAQVNDGYRTVPNARIARANLEKTKDKFENLAEPINRLQSRLTLAGCMKPDDFYIPPMLLLGEPGIGKTCLAMQLAKSLDVPMGKISAGNAQGAFQFTGSHTSWASARPGSLFTLLAAGKSATPIVIVDEVDKIRDAQYPVLPVLLDLLERETAKQFKDEFFEMTFDASKIIFVLTANSLDGAPPALISRCEIFEVPRPLPKQRLRIIEEVANSLRNKTRMSIVLDKSTSVILSERMDIDLRGVTRLVEEAFAIAIQSGESVALLYGDKCMKQYRSDAFGRSELPRTIH